MVGLRPGGEESTRAPRFSRYHGLVTTTNNLYIVGSGARVFSLSPPGCHLMRTILREDESGVSEVIGTILILAMTVVLFSVIIVWVSAIPTPAAQARTDI